MKTLIEEAPMPEPTAPPADPQAALYAALARAQGRMTNLRPTGTGKVTLKSGGSYEYRYVEYDDLLDMVRPILADEGLALTFVSTLQDGLRGMAVALTHRDGGLLTWFSPFASDPSTEQLLGIAESYRRRYVTHGITGTAANRDQDGAIETAAATPQTASARTATAPTQSAPAAPSVGSDAQKTAINKFFVTYQHAQGFPDTRKDKDGARAKRDALILECFGESKHFTKLSVTELARLTEYVYAKYVRPEQEPLPEDPEPPDPNDPFADV
jgi:hypothetical protein